MCKVMAMVNRTRNHCGHNMGTKRGNKGGSVSREESVRRGLWSTLRLPSHIVFFVVHVLAWKNTMIFIVFVFVCCFLLIQTVFNMAVFQVLYRTSWETYWLNAPYLEHVVFSKNSQVMDSRCTSSEDKGHIQKKRL